MIGDLLRQWGSSQRREFEHDRRDTIGSSEIGRCARATVFGKLGVPADDGFVESWGAALRGTLIEDNYFYPALKAAYGDRLKIAGPEQQTLVINFLSATPDGVITGMPSDCLQHLGVEDIGGSDVLVECKSIDPRANLLRPRPEHEFQVQVAMGLVRRSYLPYKPAWAVISYIDASFLDKITEFAVRFDERIYEAADKRALQIWSCEDPLETAPEGKLAGGKECEYCPWFGQCRDTDIRRVPEGGVRLPAGAVAELKGMRDLERQLAASIEDSRMSQSHMHEAMKQLLRNYDARAHRDKGWSVQWSVTKPRVSVDTAAMEAAGVDLEPFKKEGKAGERLTIT
jgi:hypothetical protein